MSENSDFDFELPKIELPKFEFPQIELPRFKEFEYADELIYISFDNFVS